MKPWKVGLLLVRLLVGSIMLMGLIMTSGCREANDRTLAMAPEVVLGTRDGDPDEVIEPPCGNTYLVELHGEIYIVMGAPSLACARAVLEPVAHQLTDQTVITVHGLRGRIREVTWGEIKATGGTG